MMDHKVTQLNTLLPLSHVYFHQSFSRPRFLNPYFLRSHVPRGNLAEKLPTWKPITDYSLVRLLPSNCRRNAAKLRTAVKRPWISGPCSNNGRPSPVYGDRRPQKAVDISAGILCSHWARISTFAVNNK